MPAAEGQLTTICAPFVDRVPVVMNRIDPKASIATAYCCLVWQ
jgi:hypothetical protein